MPGHSDELSQKDKIQILLSEYSAYRAEIINRTGYGFQMIAISAAAAAWLLVQSLKNYGFWIGLTLLALVIGTFWHANWRDLRKASQRVQELEHEINSRAGEHLLVGERLLGVAPRMGLMASLFSEVPALPRSHLPPLDSKFRQEKPN